MEDNAGDNAKNGCSAVRPTAPHIVVLGAGYAGLRAALTLDRLLRTHRTATISLVERGDSHELKTDLHRVAAGTLAPQEAYIPLSMVLHGTRVQHVRRTVQAIDTAARIIITDGAPIAFDGLILALGGVADPRGIDGLANLWYPLTSLSDAQAILARLQATRGSTAPADTPIVVGAGWTGVELATEMADGVWRGGRTQIVLVEAGRTILPGFPATIIDAAMARLAAQAIRVRRHSPVMGVADGHIAWNNGAHSAASTIIWTAGVLATPLLQRSMFSTGAAGRVRVTATLAVPGHPGVFAAGDCALILDPLTGIPIPPSAQLAIPQGEIAAYNLVQDLRGGAPITYRPIVLAQALSLGTADGLVVGGPWMVRGRAALAVKSAIARRYLKSITGPRGHVAITHDHRQKDRSRVAASRD